jgi:hypothetical protein
MYNNEFICPDKHAFSANAKIRARCPECGKMARRTYVPKEVPTPVLADGVEPATSPEITPPEPTTNGLQLIRRGRPKGIMVAKKTTPAKDANGRFVSSKKPTSDKSKKPVTKTSNQLVSRKTVSAGTKKKPTMPKVVKRPPRTAIARHIAGGKVSYADQMIGSYGIRR